MKRVGGRLAAYGVLAHVLVAALLAIAVVAIFVLAPTEETMGDAQRIVYVHVSVAWVALLCFLVMAAGGVVYLARRDLGCDHWARAAAELGWLCSTLTLATGSLWAHSAWNTWWTWDPRLAATFVLWVIYSGCLIVRAGLEDPHRRARVGAVLAILGLLDLPMVVMATRWFRGVHPASPQMEPSMRAVLLVSIAAFTALFALLLVRRRTQLHLQSLLAPLEQRTEI